MVRPWVEVKNIICSLDLGEVGGATDAKQAEGSHERGWTEVMPRESLLNLESVSIALGSHCLQGSELSAVKFVKKTEAVVCALKFNSTNQGWQHV